MRLVGSAVGRPGRAASGNGAELPELDEGCPRLEELAPVAVGILVEPGYALLGHTSGRLGLFGPPLGRGKPGAKAVVVMLEASCAAALGPQVTPEGERVLEFGGEAFPVGTFPLCLRRPFSRPTHMTRLAVTKANVVRDIGHARDNVRTGRNSRTPPR
jgi:hypothetical protein